MKTTGGAGNLRHRLLFSVLLCGCGIHHMAHQHGGGHGAHTARHGGDGTNNRLRGNKIDVTHQLAIRLTVDPDVNHDGAFLDPFALDQAGFAGGA